MASLYEPLTDDLGESCDDASLIEDDDGIERCACTPFGPEGYTPCLTCDCPFMGDCNHCGALFS